MKILPTPEFLANTGLGQDYSWLLYFGIVCLIAGPLLLVRPDRWAKIFRRNGQH